MAEFGGFRTDLSGANAPKDADGVSADAERNNTAHRLGLDLTAWEERVQSFMDANATIITFRGAGSVNGIEPDAASTAVAQIRDQILELRSQGIPVVLMFDGDPDNRAKPDIGAVFGELADIFNKDPNVVAIAAQCEGWYGPPTETSPIKSANGTNYETYVFSDDLEGQHASLTQSSDLVAYQNYQQIFVGPAGQIAFSQLKDVSEKAASNRSDDLSAVKIAVFGTTNNPALSAELAGKLDAAEGDDARAKVQAKITQREEHPYGFLFTPSGEFSVDTLEFPGLEFEVVKVGQ